MYGLGWCEIVPPPEVDGTANADPTGTRHLGMADAEPPRVPWVSESVIVSDSAIAGRGMFTNQALEPGRVVLRLGGRLVSTEELTRLIHHSDRYVDTVAVFEDVYLVLPSGTTMHYGNHSCEPNLWHVGPYEIAARRRIGAGEELTMDYGTQSGAPGFSMACIWGQRSAGASSPARTGDVPICGPATPGTGCRRSRSGSATRPARDFESSSASRAGSRTRSPSC